MLEFFLVKSSVREIDSTTNMIYFLLILFFIFQQNHIPIEYKPCDQLLDHHIPEIVYC
jgi:hypothetical protein